MVSMISHFTSLAINTSMIGFVPGILPKFFYLLLQLSFLVALVALNWEFLTTESDGIVVLVLVVVLSLGTLIFYFLTGLTDPGFVRNQIFENHYETTEFIEDDEQNAASNNNNRGFHGQTALSLTQGTVMNPEVPGGMGSPS